MWFLNYPTPGLWAGLQLLCNHMNVAEVMEHDFQDVVIKSNTISDLFWETYLWSPKSWYKDSFEYTLL